jgi:UDP-N-acetylglucosamine/UDP-N-acetylgalactosamine diphosphorylase
MTSDNLDTQTPRHPGAPPLASESELRKLAAAFSQEHVFDFWSDLTAIERRHLLDQIRLIDFKLVRELYAGSHKSDDWSQLARQAEPPMAFRLDGSGNRWTVAESREVGKRALRAGEVGAVLVAGGQGTRLGFDHPKGMYEIGPVSGASLFQILFEKLIAVGRRHQTSVPLYLMTSQATHGETEAYLLEKRQFGLPELDLHIFCQGSMPAVDAATGRVLLSGKAELALSPDGHGGIVAALEKSGGLADMNRRGIKHLFYFQVDNPLVEMCDPDFLGYHILAASEMSTLAVAKVDPTERVGNIVQIAGRTRIIEYSDLPADVAAQQNPDGSLRLWAGNTAIHVLDVSFLERASADREALPFHVARKKVPYIDGHAKLIDPKEPNAIKLERFVFDLLPLAKQAIVMETDVAKTFAPVKNAPGDQRDSPDTCRAALTGLYRDWLDKAGCKVAPDVAVEISPLWALDADDVRAKRNLPASIGKPAYFSEGS